MNVYSDSDNISREESPDNAITNNEGSRNGLPNKENENNKVCTFNLFEDLNLDPPDLTQPDYDVMWDSRMGRNLELMARVSPSIANRVSGDRPGSANKNTPEIKAAVCIQKHFRGHLGRKIYLDKLYESFQRDEERRNQKQIEQVAEGQILIENQALQTEIEECITTRKNQTRQINYSAAVIQLAWRNYKESKLNI